MCTAIIYDIKNNIKKGYEDLANAIIVQATDDYIFAVKSNNKRSIMAIKKFFYSKYFELLSDADPDYIIENLEKLYFNTMNK